jgi:hypothetical protein
MIFLISYQKQPAGRKYREILNQIVNYWRDFSF